MVKFEVVAEQSLNSNLGNDTRWFNIRSSTFSRVELHFSLFVPFSCEFITLCIAHALTNIHRTFWVARCLVLGWMPWQCSGWCPANPVSVCCILMPFHWCLPQCCRPLSMFIHMLCCATPASIIRPIILVLYPCTNRVYCGLPLDQIFTHYTLTLTNHTRYRYTRTCDLAVFFFTKPLVCLIPRGYFAFSYTEGIRILYVLVSITKK